VICRSPWESWIHSVLWLVPIEVKKERPSGATEIPSSWVMPNVIC